MKQRFNVLALLFFVTFSALASLPGQDGPYKLNWHKQVEVGKSGNKPVTIPFFAGGDLNYEEKLPYFSVQIPDAHVANFQFKNPVYAAFTAEEAKHLPKEKLKASPEFLIKNGIANGKKQSVVIFVPIRINPQTGQTEKLVSFEYTYTQLNANLRETKSRSNRIYAQNSVLSAGDWYKIGVSQSGMYKIDFNTLQQLGMNPQNIDPRRLQLYGNGGGMLPQANSTERADDLTQNAIMVVGENDGAFNQNDYILFYGQGPHTWRVDSVSKRFTHVQNVYSDTAYYFLTVGATPGTRVNTRTVSGTPNHTITKFPDRFYHEVDRVNLLKSGREWYGEEFNSFTLSKDFDFNVSDIAPNSIVALTSSVLGTSPVSSSIGSRFSVRLGNTLLGNQDIVGTGGGEYSAAGIPSIQTFNTNINTTGYNNSSLRVNLQFNQMGLASTRGFLNYLELNVERHLRLYNNQTSFRSFENRGPQNISTFKIANVFSNADTYVWDITNPVIPVQHTVNFSNNEATFQVQTNKVREFIVFNGSGFPAPHLGGRIPNQNLHSLNKNGQLDLVIVAHPKFLNQANRLANHRTQHDKLNVAVVTTKQVYNEFSSGAQDVTAIRDLMKMVYDRRVDLKTKTADSLIYLLLFGDASHDYKYNRLPNNTNFVPVYESRNSLAPLSTYSSEDYFGFLDDSEGTWVESPDATEMLDIGIGRLVATSEETANILVTKLIDYDNPTHYGKWRNRISFIADDEDNNSHQIHAELVSNRVNNKYPEYNVNKVYLDMFKQIPVANGKRSPDFAAEIDRSVEQGSLISNYVGHGGETGWGHEQFLTVNQVNNWNNYNNPTFMVTATCEFGRYDDPMRASAAELALLNVKGGAIGMVTTTRPVFQHSNDRINSAFFATVLEPIYGRMPRLGDVLKITKNGSISGTDNRNFAMLGDPSMRLAYPKEAAEVTAIAVSPNQMLSDTLKALSTVTLSGRVTDKQQNLLSTFNGKVQVTVFEKTTLVKTLGDNNHRQDTIRVRESVIYDGTVTAVNGNFKTTFVVPKDIMYQYGYGKVSLYAYSGNVDANGAKTDVVIGGSDSSAPLDTIPPVINLFMDNESFVYGGLTGNNSMLISKLSDDSGINTAGLGIGHEITATLDGNKENVKVLNDYYTADLDNFRSGRVRYMFKSLTPGPHELKVKAWDTHNNSSEKRIEFVVANSAGLALDHILNYPNPFSTHTSFHFDHNRAGDDLDIQIQIFTVTGRLIKTLSKTVVYSDPHIGNAASPDPELSWNGRDDFGDVLGKGVYVYKLNVRSKRDGAKVSKFEKLVLLN